MPRLFVAIDFPDTVNQRLASLAGGVRGARWLPPEQFHLTLRFIGEVGNDALADIAEALSAIRAAPFTVRLSGVGHFPPRGQPRVLWAGVEDNAALADLNRQIEARLRGIGLAPERRNFAPHVTLARLKQVSLGRVRDFLADHADYITESMAIDEFHLYSSTLGARGAVHLIEASYGLDDNA